MAPKTYSVSMRLGIAHHFGWAIAVTAAPDHQVVDRRRIRLIEPGMPVAPVHQEAKRLDLAAVAALVAEVRASALRATAASLAGLAASIPMPVVSISLRAWPTDFPGDIETQLRPPYESRADSVMYRQVLAECARNLGWTIHLFDASQVEAQVSELLSSQAQRLLHGPKATLGPPWTKDHRIALAAAILAGATGEPLRPATTRDEFRPG